VAVAVLLVGGLAGGLLSGSGAATSTTPGQEPDEKESAIVVGGRTWETLSNNDAIRIVQCSWDCDVIFLTSYIAGTAAGLFGRESPGISEIYMSRDAGRTFLRLTDSRLPAWPSDYTKDVAMNPDATCIAIGTASNKIYVSKDEGQTFTATETPLSDTRLVAMSDDCNIIVVAPFNILPTPIYISRDGGETFANLVNTTFIAGYSFPLVTLACDATCTHITAVGQDYKGQADYSGGRKRKTMIRSNDGGQTWTWKNFGKNEWDGAWNVCVDRGATVILVASTFLSGDGIIYGNRHISTDSGSTFTTNPAQMQWLSCALSAEPSTGKLMTMYAGNEKEMSVSYNLGRSWDTFSIDGSAHASISCDYNCDTVVIATFNRVYISRGG
jgi:photosystem II stability/assembly factor-like uncharacterized protein